MNINDVYGGPFLRPEDIARPVRVAIKETELTTFRDGRTGDEKKQIILHFHSTDKRLGLNRTNAQIIAKMHGENTDGWFDKEIILQVEPQMAFGEMKDTIRVRYVSPHQNEEPAPLGSSSQPAPPPARQQSTARPTAPASFDSLPADDFDDGIPF